jgi:transcriptional regulator with XRE-family HTH domain
MTHQGKRIDEVRKQIGITKAELARRIGTSNQNLHSIFLREKIKSIDYLKKFSEALNHDFLNEFYKDDIEDLGTSTSQGKIDDGLIEKYKMQGRIEQLEEMLKSEFSKEISERIVSKINNQLNEIFITPTDKQPKR